jgi:aspartate dehydrogenase
MTPTIDASPRVAVIGMGAIGRRVEQSLRRLLPAASIAVLVRPHSSARIPDGVNRFTHPEALADWRPQLAIECAGHAAVASAMPCLLQAGSDGMVVSVGALADDDLRGQLNEAARTGGTRLLTVAGAIGSLDALSAAKASGLASVVYTGRKPPTAWRGTLAESSVDLSAVDVPVTVFDGTARGSAIQYPQNANVTAAVALAGIGFDDTLVRLVVDPTIAANVHELEVRGGFGHFTVRYENQPLPDNPKTSWLTTLSIEKALADYFAARHWAR